MLRSSAQSSFRPVSVKRDRLACLPGFTRDYDRTEIIADGVAHGIMGAFALAGAFPLLQMAGQLSNPVEHVSVLLYEIGLLAMLASSTAYNLWPVGACKWFLRRCDKAAIYLMMAATITPFIVHTKAEITPVGFPVVPWAIVLVCIAFTFACKNRFTRNSVLPYFAFGGSCALFYGTAWLKLSGPALWLLAAGGLLYSAGVPLYLWQRLRFQQVFWHAFVWIAATCHYFAILYCISSTAT